MTGTGDIATDRPGAASRPLRLLLVDDEPLALLRLQTLLADLQAQNALSVVGAVQDARQALAWLQEHPPPDGVLLDIRMPGATAHEGLVLAERLRAGPGPVPAVVFVTAHPEHALQAFDLQAVDYLTKPVRRDRLSQALQRIRMHRDAQDGQAAPMPAPPAAAAGSDGRAAAGDGPTAAAAAAAWPDAALVFTERGRVLRVPLTELVCLQAERKLVRIRTLSSSHWVDESLAQLQARLPRAGPGRCVRIHRNALVAVDAVRELALRWLPAAQDELAGENWAVRLAPGDEWLRVSRRQLAAVKEAIGARR